MSNIAAVITQEHAKISCNFDQVEQAIKETLSEFEGVVFTEESKTYAKKQVASLRAQKKEFQERLRDAKNQYMAPWNAVESRAKNLIALYDEPIKLINGQVQAFEEKRVREKKAGIEAAYNELVPEELQDYIPLECIYGTKWDNATTNMKTVRKEISEAVAKTQGDISVISSMISDKVQDALHLYMSDRNLAAAIKYINDYEARKKEILEQQEKREAERAEALRREEIEKIRREERVRIAEEERIREEARKETVEELKAVDEQAAAPLASNGSKKILYTVVATKEEIEEIEMVFTSLGIYFERKMFNDNL